ncbi:MAG: phosphatase PAP2 family protein [Candidatus Shapirobacteria bacterium]|jgi:undecaprenyl-diphosphatase
MNDWQILEWLTRRRNPVTDWWFGRITLLGNWQVVVIIGIVVAVWLYYKKSRYLKKWLMTGISSLVVGLVKNVVGRERPPKDWAIISQEGYSFPSGHAYLAVAFWGLLIYWTAKAIKNKRLRRGWLVIAITMASMLAGSRIYVGVHWASDVMAGLALGGLWLVLMINWRPKSENQRNELGQKNPNPDDSRNQREN